MQVKIIIPIYKTEISELEHRSLQQAYQILSNYPICIIKPESLDLSQILKGYPQVTIESFEDEYFKGISGYNQLMLSSDFYARFSDYEYILIYQLDAYVFKDELAMWCSKGYDYIGAPWLQKPVYRLPVIKQFMHLSFILSKKTGRPNKQSFWNKIGNGGLSLRKVKSHYATCINQKEQIEFYLSQKRSHFYNEDVFWATEARGFSYPDTLEALHFAFDKYPKLSYKLTEKQLPFGCHSWYKRKMKKFWQPIIGF